MFRRNILLAVIAGAFSLSAAAQYIPVEPNPFGQRPVIVPVPTSVAGLDEPVLTFQGGWENTDDGMLQRTFRVPEAFAGRRIVIRFTNTTQDVKFWVNGQHVRDYWGASGAWTADITDFVKPGSDATLALRITRSDGLGKYVRFAPVVRDPVQVYALPQGYVERMRLHTSLDGDDATVRLHLKTAPGNGGSVRLSFTSPQGKKLKVTPATVALPKGMDEFQYDFKVKRPLRWDAEHPNLYTATLNLLDAKGKVVETIEQQYGFREVELRGKNLYVNGQEVKFRGIWGSNSASLMRSLNVNHTRQKWATEALLDSCDVYGIYVLDENSVDFAKFGAEIDPQYAYQWLALIEEKIERDYNHPSVVMWGLGNESFHGANVLATHKYCKAEDPDRPTIFSWANRVRPDEEIPYDVYSFHYTPMDADLSSYGHAVWHSESLLYDRAEVPGMPVLCDESTHVCISDEELARDPGVRNFWGESIKDFWDRCWETDGSLGCDQFGLYRYINANTPEIWHLRKAFSPFVIRKTDYDTPAVGQPLKVEVENRFCHTDLDETVIEWKVGGASGTVKGPGAAPRAKATFEIPYKQFKDGDVVELAVRRGDGVQVDEYLLRVGFPEFRIPQVSGECPSLEETDRYISIKGKEYTLLFDKYAGQIESVAYKGRTVITGGPHLQLQRSGIDVGEYWPQSVAARIEGCEAVIDLDVIYSPITAAFQIRIDGDGLMTVHYTVKHTPDPAPGPKSLKWNEADLGGYSEVGVKFTLPSETDRLTWDRKSLWTTYPEDHVGRPQGTAYKAGKDGGSWADMDYDIPWTDSHWGIEQREHRSGVSNDFRSSKEYIRTAAALLEGCSTGVMAMSEESDAVRMEVAPRTGVVTMIINNLWNYPTLGIGNYMKPAITIGDGYSDTVYLKLVN